MRLQLLAGDQLKCTPKGPKLISFNLSQSLRIKFPSKLKNMKDREEQLQEELRQSKEQLRQAQEEIIRLKGQALVDIDKLLDKFEEYDVKRREYESAVERQTSQRENRASSQFGWGQAINFVPVFSHAYNYGTSKANELVEYEQKEYRETLNKATNEKYQEVQKLYNHIKDCYKEEKNND
ncbi:9514_t:CDS:2 [Ambispora gerdemannii]|uniref:9514_t:CDS:1 n=1 Tax=Ambispora gerdemannii TaxID=144530 RepID=A0A9N9H1F7_9GLOM|nr:9514_t:CDS:2 [Ambispora gerdemannii]